MAPGHSTLILPDGAQIAYEILGSLPIGRRVPIVFIRGMSLLRNDWDALAQSLARTRPDTSFIDDKIFSLMTITVKGRLPSSMQGNRGMGNSKLAGNEELTIELMARDLAFLLKHLGWKQIAICGYSMGGVIAQQLLVLPYHKIKPTPLPFQITHVLLISTRSVADENVGLNYSPAAPDKPMSLPEGQTIATKMLATILDPEWIQRNPDRFKATLGRFLTSINNRPGHVITKQASALRKFDFQDLLVHIPSEIKVIVIHGELDQVIPFRFSQDTLKRVPAAQFVEQGDQPGQIPTLAFGHHWYEYFNVDVWRKVINRFVDNIREA